MSATGVVHPEPREAVWFLGKKLLVERLKARCPWDYQDIVLHWAQKGDLNPLTEFFENRAVRTRSLRLKPSVLKFLAEVLRRAKKADKKIATMETVDRQFEIATFVHMRKASTGLTKAYEQAAEKFGYKGTRQIRTIYSEYRKFCELELLQWQAESMDFDEQKKAGKRVQRKLGMPQVERYEIDPQALREHLGSGQFWTVETKPRT